MARLGMVFDLFRCIGCHACTIACKAHNGTPPGIFWAKVLEKEVGKYPTAKRIFLPTACNHCKEPPCRDVCPTGATEKREDGIVTIDPDKCIGCRACMAACPYDARYYLKKITPYYPISEQNPAPGFTPFEEWVYKTKPWHQEGTVQKCTLCSDRLEEGKEPSCVETCPTNARTFGDFDDPISEVSKLVVQRRGFQLREEEATDPSIFYID